MKVKNIVRSAAAALDLSGAVKYCDDGDESGKAEAEELLRLYCETEKDVAVNYMPILFEEKTSATDGKIEYAALSKPFLRTAYLLSESGERASYRAYAVSENGSEKSRDRIRLRACGQNDDGRLRICDGRARKSVCDGDRCGVLSGKTVV